MSKSVSDAKKTLLLVEDEPIIALSEKALLEKHGYAVITASSGEKAITQADESAIDLILMDIDLGKGRLDGTKTAQRILATHDLPIIFLTNYSEKRTVEKVKGITRYGYLLKNSGEFVIIEAINMAFELFSANQQMKAEVRERKVAEQARDESLRIAENIVHSIPSGLFIYQFREPDLLYLMAGNPESGRLTGIDVEGSIGKEFNEIWPQAKESGITDSFLSAYKTGKTYETEEMNYEDEKLTGAFRVRAFRMPKDQLCIAFENITDSKKAEQELRKSRTLLDSIVENIPTMVFVKDSKDLSFTLFNRAGEDFLGIPRKEMIGKNDYDYFPKDEADFFIQKDREVLESANLLEIEEEEIQTASGNRRIHTKKVPILGSDGKPEYLLGISEDITERLKSEQMLRENEERFRSVVQMARDAIVVCNFNDTIIFWNDAAEQIFGHTADETIGKTVEMIIPPAFHGKYHVELKHRQDSGTKAIDLSLRELSALRKDGSSVSVERTISWWKANDQLFVTRIYRDITKRKENIEKLRESEERYRSLFEHAPDGIITVNADAEVTSCNSAFLSLSGFQQEDIIGRLFSKLPILRIDDLPKISSLLTTLFKGETVHFFPLTWVNKKGEERQGEARFGFYKVRNRIVEVQFIIQDNTEKKQIEEKLRESEYKYERLFTVANDAIFLADAETAKLIDVNEKGEELTGRPRDELIGMQQTQLHPPEQESKIKESFENDAKVGNSTHYKEWDVIHKDGTLIPVEIVPSVIELKGRKVVMGIFRDITERRQYEQSMEKALEEKEALLREINHRVKNNLTMISALLRLKASSLEDEIDLSDVEHQIDAIRIVHEILLVSDHISHIELNVYVQELLETIFSSFANRSVEIANSIPVMHIPTNQAVSLGLIINEIATNAIKYGFRDDETALFSINLKNDNQNRHYICTLSNSGNPFPEQVDFENSNSLGLKIITLLVEQLEGKIHLRKQPTPEYTIQIPLKDSILFS